MRFTNAILALAILFVPVFRALGAAAQVQTSTQTSGTATSTGITMTATGSNNLVVCHIKFTSNARSVSSVSDGKSNSYTIGSAVDNSTQNRIYQIYGVQATSGATTITLTFDASGTFRAGCDEYSGTATASVQDVRSSGTGSSSPLAVSTLSPATSGELIVCTMGLVAARNWTAGASYTLYNGTGSVSTRSQYRLSGTTSETGPATYDSTATNWAEICSAYKLASGGSTLKDPLGRGIIPVPRAFLGPHTLGDMARAWFYGVIA